MEISLVLYGLTPTTHSQIIIMAAQDEDLIDYDEEVVEISAPAKDSEPKETKK